MLLISSDFTEVSPELVMMICRVTLSHTCDMTQSIVTRLIPM